MTTTHAIAAVMAGQDATNGWDVAYAMNLRQVNALFLQQYLQNGPTSPSMPLRVILEVQPSFWILDVILGPPKLVFQSDSETAVLEMELVRGALIAFDPGTQTIHNAALIRPNESRLTGPVSLSKIAVTVDQPGRILADLGAKAYTPTIAGVDPQSVLLTELGLAVKNFFAANNTKYPLGSIAPTQAPPCLKPTDFEFYTQQKPNSNDACLLLLIHTNGTKGTVGPLSTYPIPDNQSAAMIISGRVIFGGLLVDYMNQVFAPLSWRFSAQQNGAFWKVTSSGGELDFGQIGRKTTDNRDIVFSCDDRMNERPVRIGCDGFTVQPSNGNLVASWHRQWGQLWGKFESYNFRTGIYGYSVHNSTIETNYDQSGKPWVDPNTAEVTFRGDPRYDVKTPGAASWLEKILLNSIDFPEAVRSALQNRLSPILQQVRLPSVNTFVLTNLLFPSRHAVSMQEAAIPGDLYLTGQLLPPIEVTPAETSVAPGKTIQFKASGKGSDTVKWVIKPAFGTINAGLYTAPGPDKVKAATVVVVSAVNKSDESLAGSAMVLVYEKPAAAGVAVSPATTLVMPGQSAQLSTADANGHAVAVDWTLAQNLGTIKKGFATGQYTYTAPAKVGAVTEVRAQAVSSANHALHGEGVIRLLPTVQVTVSPAESTLALKGKLELTASAAGVDPLSFRWVVYPTGAGTVTPHDDRSKASYEAPAKAPDDPDVKVMAYTIDDSAGLGWAVVTLK